MPSDHAGSSVVCKQSVGPNVSLVRKKVPENHSIRGWGSQWSPHSEMVQLGERYPSRFRTQVLLSAEHAREGLCGSPLPLPSENCPPKKTSLLLRVQIIRLPSFPPLCPHHKSLQHHAQRARSGRAKLRMPKKARLGFHYRFVSSMGNILTAPLQTS